MVFDGATWLSRNFVMPSTRCLQLCTTTRGLRQVTMSCSFRFTSLPLIGRFRTQIVT